MPFAIYDAAAVLPEALSGSQGTTSGKLSYQLRKSQSQRRVADDLRASCVIAPAEAALRERMAAELVCEALAAAIRLRRPPPGLIFHSDRGSQYASSKFRRRLARHAMRQSMSRKGDCWDNAVAESFFATLKKELVRDHVFATRDEASAAVFEYIEIFYNRKRAHSLLRYVSPSDFESCINSQNVA